MFYTESANRKSNEQNYPSPCIEIMEYTDENEVAVYNLASIAIVSLCSLCKNQGLQRASLDSENHLAHTIIYSQPHWWQSMRWTATGHYA